jgi:hypothetical protein
MENNLLIYDLVKEVPEDAKKTITGGRLNGMTDIKPMWRIKKLTEIFGPVGIGWYTETIKKEILEGANEEKIAVEDILLYVNYKKPYGLKEDMWSKPIEGSGGSSFVSKEKAGYYTSDECFKMAYTDALSVACRSIGIGANVYWSSKNGSKYDKQTTTTETPKQTTTTNKTNTQTTTKKTYNQQLKEFCTKNKLDMKEVATQHKLTKTSTEEEFKKALLNLQISMGGNNEDNK